MYRGLAPKIRQSYMVSSAAASNAGGQASRPLRRLFFGLQFKFTLLVLSLTLSVAAMVGAVLVDLVGEFAQGQERRQCVQLANLLAHSSARVLESGDHQALQDLAQQYSTSQPVLFVTFTDAAGQQLASASRAHTEGASYRECQPLPNHSGLIGQAVLVTRQAGCPIHLVTTFPINRPQRQSSDERVLIGYVQIGYDIEHTLADLAAAFDLLSGWTIAVLILTVPLAYLVVRFVVVPLNELSQVVRRFAHGNLQARTTVHSQDEIGDLAKAFNLMADDLANQHQEIIALNTELEQRVAKAHSPTARAGLARAADRAVQPASLQRGVGQPLFGGFALRDRSVLRDAGSGQFQTGQRSVRPSDRRRAADPGGDHHGQPIAGGGRGRSVRR